MVGQEALYLPAGGPTVLSATVCCDLTSVSAVSIWDTLYTRPSHKLQSCSPVYTQQELHLHLNTIGISPV